MKNRILVVALTVLATGLLIGTSSIEAASRYHLVVVHSSANTGQGVITVDRAKLHSYQLAATSGECSSASCGATYAAGTRVTLTAKAAEGSSFAGWGGDCSGMAPTCVVRMSRSSDVLVYFSK